MPEKEQINCCCNKRTTGASSAVYGLGFLGALVYFLQHVTNLTDAIIGVFKALIWPALLVFKSLELLRF